MLVGYNVKGETEHHVIDVDTDNFREAVATVRSHCAEGLVSLDRCFAVLEGGKKSAPVPVLELPPQLA